MDLKYIKKQQLGLQHFHDICDLDVSDKEVSRYLFENEKKIVHKMFLFEF